MLAVEARSSNDTLRSPCCRNAWFHRDCIQVRYILHGQGEFMSWLVWGLTCGYGWLRGVASICGVLIAQGWFWDVLQGILEDGQRHSWQGKCWMDNVKGWMLLIMQDPLALASHTKDWNWKRTSAELSLMSPWWTNWSRDWSLLNCSSLSLSFICFAVWVKCILYVTWQ